MLRLYIPCVCNRLNKCHIIHHILLTHTPILYSTFSSAFAVCGRGGGSNNHPGNEAFRELVSKVKVPYVNCPKRDKPVIARRIVEAVRLQSPPGRFLAKDPKTGMWRDIGDGRAREKTSMYITCYSTVFNCEMC